MFDIEKVTGFNDLDVRRKQVLKNTYNCHTGGMGLSLQEKWLPVKEVSEIDAGVKVVMKDEPGFTTHGKVPGINN